jgi:hypothetical protein
MDAFNAFVHKHLVPVSGPLGLGVEVLGSPASDAGFSLKLSRDAKKGDLLFRMPVTALLRAPDLSQPSTSTSPASLPIFKPSEDSDIAFSQDLPFDDLRVILELMYQRRLGPSSEFYGYISMLPRTFPTCPLHWSEEDTGRRLMGAPLYGLAEELRGQLMAAWEWTAGLLARHRSLEGYDWDSFLWAYTVVQSRAFKIAFPNKEGIETVLIPFVDMANHVIESSDALVRNLHTVDEKTGCLEAVCGRDAARGEDMGVHYNDLAPWQTLLHYGFSVPVSSPNSFDRINLSLAFPDDDGFELEARKMLLFGTIDGLSEDHSLQSEPSDEFVASVRVALATEDELDGLDSGEISTRAFEKEGLGRENEERAISTIRTMLMSLDSLYPRTLDEDLGSLEELEKMEQLADEQKADRDALRYVVGQRRLMASLRSWAEARLDEMGVPWGDKDKEADVEVED